MKSLMEEPMESEVESESGIKPEELLSQGKQLCLIGESLIATAKAMGVSESEEEEGEGYEEEPESAPAFPPAKEGSSLNGKNSAIVMAIRKKLGK